MSELEFRKRRVENFQKAVVIVRRASDFNFVMRYVLISYIILYIVYLICVIFVMLYIVIVVICIFVDQRHGNSFGTRRIWQNEMSYM